MVSGIIAPVRNMPSWYTHPEQQIELVTRICPGLVVPPVPRFYESRTETEVLLLHIPLGFNELWELVSPPVGYIKKNWGVVCAESLSVLETIAVRTQPVWVGFDPEHGKGKRSDLYSSRSDLATAEVLSAMLQFPQWPLAWFKAGVSAPRMGGYRLTVERGKTHMPALTRWECGQSILFLGAHLSNCSDQDWATPLVRDC